MTERSPTEDRPDRSQGVAILANDRVRHWLLPFLESFRRYNPRLPLYLIPYDDRLDRTREAAELYGASVVRTATDAVDRFARDLYPLRYPTHHFRRHRLRKLCCLELPLDEVLYLDVDVIVLRDLSFLFGAVAEGRAQFVYGSLSEDYVYRPRARELPRLRDEPWFSDGFFVTGRRHLDLERIVATIAENRETFHAVRHPEVTTQPVTNLAVHLTGLETASVSDLFPGVSPDTFYLADYRREGDLFVDARGREVLFAHWAGARKVRGEGVPDRMWRRFEERALRRLASGVPPERRGAEEP